MFTLEIIIVLVVLVLAIVMFATEKFSVDVVALIIMAVLIISGVISPEQGVAGFSNSATVTVAAMFILSAALFKSGAVVGLGNKLANLFQYNFWLAIITTMITGDIAIFRFCPTGNNISLITCFLNVICCINMTSTQTFLP